jgi:hypothetical protein
VASVSVIFTSSGGRFGCNSSVALGPAWRRSFRCGAACPLVFLSAVVFAKVVLDIYLSVVCWVELQLRFVFHVVVVCRAFSVGVMSQSNRLVCRLCSDPC